MDNPPFSCQNIWLGIGKALCRHVSVVGARRAVAQKEKRYNSEEERRAGSRKFLLNHGVPGLELIDPDAV